MKKYSKKYSLIFLVITFFIIFNYQIVFAKSKSEPKIFGLGIFLGQPSGITAKYWLSSKGGNALEFNLAYSIMKNNYFYFSASYLIHFFDIIPTSEGQAPLILGIGISFQFNPNIFYTGIKIPLGISYIFSNAPIDIFFEVAPVLLIFPETTFSPEIFLGIRYYF
ncbi:MAG: hypothetical protein N3A58_03600 [Spirochaetes bacterium]|nr:hypothetical protein [Spirochaetota bacterium]